MKTIFFSLLAATLLWLSPTNADAQSRSVRGKSTPYNIIAPTAPTPLDVKERTTKDLLFFPYATLSADISDADNAKEQLQQTFGSWEAVNNLFVGLHRNDRYDYTYLGAPIALCYVDWFENRNWYQFYFDTHTEAMAFYNKAAADLRKAGLPMTTDKVYGGMSSRRRPVAIFKQVYIFYPQKVKQADESNIDRADVVGKYRIELGVYKRKARR